MGVDNFSDNFPDKEFNGRRRFFRHFSSTIFSMQFQYYFSCESMPKKSSEKMSDELSGTCRGIVGGIVGGVSGNFVALRGSVVASVEGQGLSRHRLGEVGASSTAVWVF